MSVRSINALTVDVEDYFQVAALSSAVKRNDWDRISPRVEQNTHLLLDLFDEFDTKATFFTLGWVGERFPELVREIARRGHEVGCHGMDHQLVYTQSRHQFREETRRAKSVLEQAIGAAVIGYRAASYSITRKSLWALDELVSAGFVYDSSIFPVIHDLYGVPDAQRFIHYLKTPENSEIIEFPPTTARFLGRNLPASGGGYFRLYPYILSKWLLQTVEREGEPFIFYLHPWEVDPQQPRVNVGLKSRFRHYINLGRSLPRLRRLLADFDFGTVYEVVKSSSRVEQSALAQA